jgi:hypothetical protein
MRYRELRGLFKGAASPLGETLAYEYPYDVAVPKPSAGLSQWRAAPQIAT